MARFLFLYGYESPQEWSNNRELGTDDESSGAIWIHAKTEEEALSAGCKFAEKHVAELFASHPELSFPSWSPANYASCIEHNPLQFVSQEELNHLPETNFVT